MLFRILLILTLFAPVSAFAVGGEDTGSGSSGGASTGGGSDAGMGGGGESNDHPTTTPTSTSCADGQYYDWASKQCKSSVRGEVDDDTLYRAVRELAYNGRYQSSLMIIAAMSDEAQTSDRVLTYLGFNNRKLGNVELGLSYYRQALAINPGNILVRSYLGQHFAETGQIELAQAQLSEIRRRGGRNTWAEFALRLAIDSGHGLNY